MEIEKKRRIPAAFAGKNGEVYPDEGGYRAKCSNCGIHTIVCKSQYSAVHAYLSVTHAYNFTLVKTSEADNRERIRRKEAIAKIREKLDLLRYFKGPLHELDEISTLLEELK